MRYLRTAMVAAALTVAFVVPSTASAQINTAQIGTTAQLGPEGASLTFPVTVNCDPGFTITGIGVEVIQSSGKVLTRGVGGIGGIECTGSDQVLGLGVSTFSASPYKQGKASAGGQINVFNFATGEPGFATMGPQEIRIRR
jgi:hypothetical protein